MKNRLLLLALVPLFLTSCSKGMIRYGVKPYIEVEHVEVGEIKTLLPSEIKTKMENKESFPLFLQMTNCSACKYSKENYIYPFLENNPIILYSINSEEIRSNEQETEIYKELTKPFNNVTSDGYSYVPYMSIIDNGEYKNGEGDMRFFTTILEAYLVL